MKQFLLPVFASVLLSFTVSALAADLYRCGNTFQDTPCGSSTNSQSTKSSTAPASRENVSTAGQASSTPDADCKQRGEAAKKIMWMREIGKTADDQVAIAPDRASQLLVIDVYNHRGSSLQVKNAIEQECMQQKEKDKLAEKLMIEAERLKAGGSISFESTNKNKLVSHATPAAQDLSKITQITNDKVEQCNYIKSGIERVAYKRRKGGNAEHMDNLKREQNSLASEFKSAGC